MNEDTLTFNSVKIEFISLKSFVIFILSMDPELGRMSKRIIDYCRCEYIKSRVNRVLEQKQRSERFRVKMVYYCEAEESPENCLILGWIWAFCLINNI